jgi:hypothetical protein
MYMCAVVQFKVSKLDVADPVEARQIIELADSMAPVGGIFHLAMTLTDKLLPNQVCSDARWGSPYKVPFHQ